MLICGLSEDIFWNASPSFLKSVDANKHAYDQWLDGMVRKKNEEAERRAERGKE